MNVLKFGGSSLGSVKNIKNVRDILKSQDDPFIVVVSATLGTTDRLNSLASVALEGSHAEPLESLKQQHLDLITEILKPAGQSDAIIYTLNLFNQLENICTSLFTLQELSDKSLAQVLSFGERLSSGLIQKYLAQEGMELNFLDSHRLIRANHSYLNAEVDLAVTENLIRQEVKEGSYIAPGFIASNEKGEMVVLGRGGSDFSAAIYAYAMNALSLEIWSDVNGMLNADPKLVQQASSIEKLSYKEAFELAYFGARVLYPPAIRPVMQKNIPVYLKNTLQPSEKGTLISHESAEDEEKIRGIASLGDISLVTVSGVGMAGTRGTARQVFQAMEQASVNVILITQSCSEQSICFGIQKKDVPRAVESLNKQFSSEMEHHLVNPVEVLHDQSIIAVVGDNMRHKVGLSGKIFGALGENGINVYAIAQGASERNISVVVHRNDEAKAINVIHERFFLKAIRRVHLYIAGVGNVGSEFIRIVRKQQSLLMNDYQIDLRIAGVANSRKMLIKKEGLDESEISSLSEKGLSYSSFNEYVTTIKKLNLRNSIFIDNTPAEVVSNSYRALLESSISVVACNKIAMSSALQNYRSLLQLAKERNSHFQYETSVGAALPVIKTIRDLLLSGDSIHRIQAVLSGSLNYIFNHYNTEKPFADIVLRAKEEGYTEPDPLIDLSGLDVMRKILILSREAGYTKELSDVRFEGFLPDSCSSSKDTEALFRELRKEEPHFSRLYHSAQEKGCKLKILAMLEEGELKVALTEIPPESPFYHLGGKDNIVALHTDRYRQDPLIIKGAGAGAEVTASGVFSDLIYIINR